VVIGAAANPVVADPAVPDSVTADPVVVDPVAADPVVVDWVVVDWAVAGPAAVAAPVELVEPARSGTMVACSCSFVPSIRRGAPSSPGPMPTGHQRPSDASYQSSGGGQA
jgi:ribonuclease E